MRILFVCGSDFRSPSEKQVLWFAGELLRLGHDVLISLGGDPASAAEEGAMAVAGLELQWHRFRGPRLRHGDLESARSFEPDLIHAFNSRVPVLGAARDYSRATGAPILVHWEDDEWGLRKGLPTHSRGRRLARLGRRALARLHPPAWYMSTPGSIRWATRHAAAFDAIAPALAEYVRERTGRDCEAILPTLPPAPEQEAPFELPAGFDRRPLVAYTGQIHGARLDDIRLCLEGVAEAQRRGHAVAFVHAGGNISDTSLATLAREAGLGPESWAALGHLAFAAMPPLLRRCTILLQVSLPTEFNRLNLPSKLQAYLASGTPTIVSAHGAGELLRDREEVMKLDTPAGGELADRIERLLTDAELRRTLSAGGPAAADRLFDPRRNTERLLRHYRDSLGPLVGEPADAGGAVPA